MKEIIKVCPGCGGTGTNPGYTAPPGGSPVPVDTTCLKCQGAGTLPNGELSDDLIDFLNDLRDKVDDILEKVNV